MRNYQTSNTWLEIKLERGRNREIRRIMQKNQLRVNRLIRTSFGPYSIGNLKHGEVIEAEITKKILALQYFETAKKLKEIEVKKEERFKENEEIVLIGKDALRHHELNKSKGQQNDKQKKISENNTILES